METKYVYYCYNQGKSLLISLDNGSIIRTIIHESTVCCFLLFIVSHTPSTTRPLSHKRKKKELVSHKAWLNPFLSYLTSDQSPTHREPVSFYVLKKLGRRS